MMINKSVVSIVLVILLALSIPQAFATDVGTWRGYVIVSGSVAANGTYVTAHIDNASTATVTTRIRGGEYALEVPQGYYSLDVECTGATVNFKVCGITVALPSESCTYGPHYNGTTPNYNLTVTKLSAGVSCSYSCGCSGGYCCSGATEYTDGTGTGTCQSSVCTGATATTQGGGGGGAAATTTTTIATTTTTTTMPTTTTTAPTTTTTLPPVEETETVASIPAGQTGTFTFTENVGISDISIKTANAVSNVQVTIERQSAMPATVAIAAPGVTHSYLTITKTNVQDADIESVTIKFKVEKSWIASNNIDEATIALNRYENSVWTALTTSKLSEDAGYVYFEVETTSLSIFAVTGQQVAVAYPSWILLVVVLLVAAVAVILVWKRRR